MEERYTHGHFGTVVANHGRRSASDSAGFLLPHLRRDHRVLDLGCGPGSITLDLAELVAEITGVDAATAAIDEALTRTATRNTGNATFVEADVSGLPFPDDTYDVVFAHQLLQHLADPVRALREARRVLRPGGLLAVRDADYGTMTHDPHDPLLDRWLELYFELARRNGGTPDAGRRLARWVHRAGFTDVVTTTTTWTYTEPAKVAEWAALWVSRLLEARMGRDAVAHGLTDERELGVLAAAWRRWARQPTPFFAFIHGEVIATKPV